MIWTDKEINEMRHRIMEQHRKDMEKMDEDYLKYLRGELHLAGHGGIFPMIQDAPHKHLYKLIKPTKLNKDGTPLWECSCGEVKASM